MFRMIVYAEGRGCHKRAMKKPSLRSCRWHDDLMSSLIVTAQHGQRQWNRVGGFPRRAPEIPPHLQVWCWNKYVRHKVGDARSALFFPLTRKVLSSHGAGGACESLFSWFLTGDFFSLCLSLPVPYPVRRSVSQLGQTGSCGALEPQHLPTQPWAQGSVAPFQGWPAGPKWRSTTTEVTWNTPSVTTNQSPPSSPCRWDTSASTVKMTVYSI